MGADFVQHPQWRLGSPKRLSCLVSISGPTNHHTGYGGFASSGWEGVAIDDVTVIHRPGTASEEQRQLANFSINSTKQIGDVSGWLDPSPNLVNEWIWTTDFGMNPASSTQRSFEDSMTTPQVGPSTARGLMAGKLGRPATHQGGALGSSILATTGPPSTSRRSTPTTSTPTSSARSTLCPTTPQHAFPSVLGFARNSTGMGVV